MALLATVVLAISAHAADSATLGDLPGVRAVLRVDDARWVEREVTRFAAAMGRDPAPIRRSVAAFLYRSKSLDGVDTSRPSLMAWRDGPSPLLAVIPVKDRRLFIDEFGVMPPGEAPLVRVGDRDGTVVYTQNHASGLREYRLMVANDVAYLARSAEECRRLVAKPLISGGGVGTPVRWTGSGVDLVHSGLGGLLPEVGLPATGWYGGEALPAMIWNDLLPQVSSLSWSIVPAGEQHARLRFQVRFHPEGSISQWLAYQKNQAGRLMVPLIGPQTAMVVRVQALWQGQCERIGTAFAPAVQASAGAAWQPSVEEAWRSLWSLAERSGEAAWILDADRPQARSSAMVIEQPRAIDQVADLRTVAAAIMPASDRPVVVAGQEIPVRRGVRVGAPLRQMSWAQERHLVDLAVIGDGDAGALAAGLSARLAGVNAPAGEPSLMSLWCDVSRLARASRALDPELVLPPAQITGVVRLVGVNGIEAELTAPMRELATVMGPWLGEDSVRR